MGGAWVSLLLGMYIHAPGQCPAAGEVERRLVPLLPPGLTSSDVAALEEHPDGSLTLSLARFDRGFIIQRRLPPASSCSEQAETVAVSLAIWAAQIQPPTSLRLDRPLPEPLAAATKPTSLIPTVQGCSDGTERGEPTARVLGIGAGLGGGWQSGSLAPAGRLDATLGWGPYGLAGRGRLRLSAVGLGEHQLDLPPGHTRWWRAYLAPGADYALGLAPRWALLVGAAGVLGFVHVGGFGYAVDHHTFSTDLGVEGLLRVAWRQPHVQPWLGLAVVTWLRRQRLDIVGGEGSHALGRIEPMVTLGADFLPGT